MSYKFVTIPVGAFLGAFVQPFVIDGDCGRRPRVFDALLFGKQGLEGVSSVTRVGWAGRDLSGGLSGCICAVLRGRSRLWAWPECNFDDHDQIKVQSVNFMEFCDRKGYRAVAT